MGKTFTPTYRVEYWDNTQRGAGALVPRLLTYDGKRHGRPDATKAEEMRRALNRSFAPGGANFHVSQAAGIVVHVQRLHIVRQADGGVAASARAPAFEVV